jgi:hypothetical protein
VIDLARVYRPPDYGACEVHGFEVTYDVRSRRIDAISQHRDSPPQEWVTYALTLVDGQRVEPIHGLRYTRIGRAISVDGALGRWLPVHNGVVAAEGDFRDQAREVSEQPIDICYECHYEDRCQYHDGSYAYAYEDEYEDETGYVGEEKG